MRLIDAEQLKDIIDDTWILDRIDEQPTVDAVEVVRCKDCAYWRNDDCQNDSHGYCPISENDFCSRGERRKKRG